MMLKNIICKTLNKVIGLISLAFGFLIFISATFLNAESPNSDPNIIPVLTAQAQEGRIYPIAIIGSGAAGTMAVKRAVLNNDETLLFAGTIEERRHSRGNWVRKIDNIPGLEKYNRAILELRNETLEELMKSSFSSNLFVVEESIVEIRKEGEHFRLIDGTGRNFFAKYVVLATGMMDEQPHIQGEIWPVLDYANAGTVAYCAICDGHRSFRKKTVVIGHSETAGSLALLLLNKYQCSSMTILTNGHASEFSIELSNLLKEKDVKVIDLPILEVLGDPESGKLTGFKLDNKEDVANAEIAFVSLGVRPNNMLALQLGAEVDATGLVITDAKGESGIQNLFVVGDLRAGSMKQVYTAWQQSVEAVQLINKRLREANNRSANL